MPNCIIAQSGGPTSVINSSVVGLLKANEELKKYDKVYGGINGIEGILNENIVELSSITEEDLILFQHTPSSGLGSCRYRMKDLETSTEEYDKLISILEKLDIKTFFYIGGNDSMDTTAKLALYAKKNSLDINFIGIPKTIDNDLMHIDHTPGFGSASKFIATTVFETFLDSSVYIYNGVFILETMGRDTGWLAASACMATYEGKPVADFIYLPEITFDKDAFLHDVKEKFKEQNQVFIVVSEGLKTKDGKFLSEIDYISQDNFAHPQLGGVCHYLRDLIIEAGITPRVKSLELGILQRCAMHCASQTDINEAFQVGYEALKFASNENNGFMVSIQRNGNSPYTVSYTLVEANKVANNIKYFPKEWINESGNHVTKEGYEYLKPLLQGNSNLSTCSTLPNYKVFNK
ncbi:6-phosphofructokinase [Clostridium vincentii]|uniref:Pyrophosphate--fructose 6-phosphate 1-phosphotransferase n=1 Tax=Clostridium vincentii TaxID=52704 RepID=A0A2T0BFX9_9CLOT|nr:6-phosphofructokinase [Clostridium vincentii]PRR82795.1 Pyrophosphate--fructose 6-phosphate 1-phosphotransferase [Clostridium vincentii]